MYLHYVWWRYLAHSLPKIRLSAAPKGLFTWARLTGLARFPRSRLTSKSFVKFSICLYERAGWLGCRDLGFSNLDLGKRGGNFAIWTLQAGHRDKRGWILVVWNPDGIVLHCLLYIHIISIPFNCSDTALRVAESIIGEKVIIFAFRQVWFVSWIWLQNSSPGSVVFSHPIWTQIWTHGLLFSRS